MAAVVPVVVATPVAVVLVAATPVAAVLVVAATPVVAVQHLLPLSRTLA
jgi:hypothetical protein